MSFNHKPASLISFNHQPSFQVYRYPNSNNNDGMRCDYQNEPQYNYYNNKYRNDNYFSNSSYYQYNHNLEYSNANCNYTNFSNISNNQNSYLTSSPVSSSSYNSSSYNWQKSQTEKNYSQKGAPRHPKYDRNNPFHFTSQAVTTTDTRRQPKKNDSRIKTKAKRLRELAKLKKHTITPSILNTATNPLESWKKSVKKTNINEGLEQKSQYLETMLRLKQKSSISSSTFDRTRFADDETLTNTTGVTNTSVETLTQLELINNIHEHSDLARIENFLFNNTNEMATQPPPPLQQEQMPLSSTVVINVEHHETKQKEIVRKPGQGFLIDCDEDDVEEQQEPSNSEELNEDQLERILSDSVLTVPDTNPIFKKKLKKKKKLLIRSKNEPEKKKKKEQIATEEESLSNWIVEFPTTSTTDDHSVTTTTATTTTTTAADMELLNSMLDYDNSSTNVHFQLLSSNEKLNRPHVDMILTMIKDQQEQLKKLRSCVMMALGISPNSSRKSATSSTTKKINSSDISEDLIKTFLSAQQTFGCWLCSGKTFSEMSVQTD
ncbi:unnamed protein product [Didymodactylos carnosus]|uniref:Uncharacterized protein n=1 Tax=Didymodactylos carnosus TaxID=1234261 RepID=A0A814BNM4_9BILA|nr:unnamed protein product [Didymodactylos carnosus]CAF1072078.1 unnamed protein product [Didymodactylos carnosus]CAF3707304.1 unnamed protein product [Didymodactylos carnosus]CAF3836361.1 unnamed protein product [Didymodactylos carnosus]